MIIEDSILVEFYSFFAYLSQLFANLPALSRLKLVKFD